MYLYEGALEDADKAMPSAQVFNRVLKLVSSK